MQYSKRPRDVCASDKTRGAVVAGNSTGRLKRPIQPMPEDIAAGCASGASKLLMRPARPISATTISAGFHRQSVKQPAKNALPRCSMNSRPATRISACLIAGHAAKNKGETATA